MAGSITDAVNRWKRGEASAQLDLAAKLQPLLLGLIGLVRRHRDPSLRARIDSEGVVYDALHTFLSGLARDEFPLLENREDVKKVLTMLVMRTLCDEIRWHSRRKRSPARELPSPGGRPQHLADPRTAVAETSDLVPDVATWLSGVAAVLRPIHEKAIEIVELSIKGLSNNDIARQVGLGLRRIQVLKKQMYQVLRDNALRRDE